MFRTQAWRAYSFPIAVCAVGVASTVLMATLMRQAIAAQDGERFGYAIDHLQDGIRDRLEMYTAILRAGAGMMTAADIDSPEQFRAFVERLELRTKYPGVQGIGFAGRVPAEQLQDALARQRRQGRADFDVTPLEPNRPEYYPILYLEPLDERNRAAIGFDMFADETRRAAMQRARDTGEPAASGIVRLVQEIDEDVQPGFLIYVPVYEQGSAPVTAAERQRAIRGFVYSPFRAHDLFRGILGSNPRPRAGFDLYDGPVAPESLLYRTGRDLDARRFSRERAIDVAGREWTVEYFSTSSLDASSGEGFLPMVAGGGSAVTVLLTALAVLQTRARRRAEASEKLAEDASRRLQQLADSISQLAWMARPDGYIYWYNTRWYEYTGTTPESMQGWGWQQVHDPAVLPRVLDMWKQSLASGQPFEMEFPLRGADGTYRLFLTRALPFHDSRGAIEHWFGTNTDVQYRHDAARSLQQHTETLQIMNRQVQQLLESERKARAEAERVSRLKDEFLATLSHELRTPLNAIVGWGHLLESGALGSNKQRVAIETILRNARIQSQLIEDLLDMSRIISGRVGLDLRPVDLRDVVEAAINVVRPTAGAKGVALDVRADGGTYAVRGDSNRLQQIVWNLLSNAVKFTPPRGRVTVTLAGRDDRVELAVADSGIGIDPEFLPYVFDRFRQADGSSTRGHGGLGLGLSIVKSLVDMHAGTIQAHSAGTGKGATFTMGLPRPGVPDVADDGRTAGPMIDVPHTQSLSGLPILVIDDDTDAGDLAAEVLTQCGADVAVARSGAEALRLLQASNGPIELIVSDLGMPDMDGYELIRRIRGLPPELGGAAPAIALTAYAGAHDQTRALAAGYNLHVAKPFTPAHLVAVCSRLVRTSAL